MEELDPLLENELIEQARGGDSQAMDRLLSAHRDRVYRTALSLVGGDGEAAFEIAQNVLISASRNLHQFRGNARLSTWLYRMTVNFRHNYLTAQKRRRDRFVSLDAPPPGEENSSGRGLHERLHSNSAGPREQAAANELHEQVTRHLQGLPDEYREALHLRYVEDLSYEEIATILDVPAGTIKSRINRGRAELRRRLSGTAQRQGGQRA